MAQVRDALLKLLVQQAGTGGAGTTRNDKIFTAAGAKGQLMNLLRDEEQQQYFNEMLGGPQQQQRELESQYQDKLPFENLQRERQQELAQEDQQLAHLKNLQDIRNEAKANKLRRILKPDPSAGGSLAQVAGGTQAASPITDPFVESAKINSIAAGANQASKGIEGFDPSNEMHRLVVKSVLEDAVKSGKPVNQLDLRTQITKKLTDLNQADNALLKTQSDRFTVKGKMLETVKKLQNKGIPGLDKKTISTLNGKINSISSQVDKFDNLARLFKGPGGRSFLESLSQLKFKSLAALQRAGIPISESQRKSLQKFTIFRTGITNVFNTYRKEITGAAASDQELVRLEKAFIHMKMSPDEFEGAVRGLKAFGEMEMWRNLKMMEDRGQALDPNYKNKLLADDPELNSSIDQNYKRVLKDWQATTEWLNGRDDLDSLKGVERSTGYGEDQVVGSIPEAAADDTIIQTRVGPKTRAELEAELKRLEGSKESQDPLDPQTPKASNLTEGEALQAAAQGKAPGGISTPTSLGQLASRSQAAPAPGDSPESLYQRTKDNLSGVLPPSQVEEIARAAANRVRGR